MKGDRTNPASRILRERALKILRETRAGIDPQFLAAMKERFSAFVPAELRDSDTPLSQSPAAVLPKKDTAPKTQGDIPAGVEAVDKQKVAQIVLQYMKNREEKSRH